MVEGSPHYVYVSSCFRVYYCRNISKIFGRGDAETSQTKPELEVDPSTHTLEESKDRVTNVNQKEDFPEVKKSPAMLEDNTIIGREKRKKIPPEIELMPAKNKETTGLSIVKLEPTHYGIEEKNRMKISCSETENSSQTTFSDITITNYVECGYECSSSGKNDMMKRCSSRGDYLPPKIDASSSSLIAEIGESYYQ